MTQIKVDGLAELRRAMLELPKEIAEKGLARSVLAGSAIVRDQAKANLIAGGHVKTKSLLDAVRHGFDKLSSSSVQKSSHVFVRYKTAKYANTKLNRRKGIVGKLRAEHGTIFYWRFIEFGTVGPGKHHITAKRFIRNAFDMTMKLQIEAIRASLEKSIEKAAAKVSSKA